MLSRVEPITHKSTDTTVQHQRVNASAAVAFKLSNKRTVLDRLYQQGSAKVRFPKTYHGELETVLINTAGGLTADDRLAWDLNLNAQTKVVATTQACEKAYRAIGSPAKVQTNLNLSANSLLHWLPQETILYNGSALERTFDVTMELGATLLAIEPIVFGRSAMGEQVRDCYFKDRWRIKQNGKLVFAENICIQNPLNTIARFGTNAAAASLLFISPKDQDLLGKLTLELNEICPKDVGGFSCFDGKITGRLVAQDSYELRKTLIPVLKFLRGSDLPRVWRI